MDAGEVSQGTVKNVPPQTGWCTSVSLTLQKTIKAILKMYPDEALDERADVRGNTTLAVVVLENE